MLGAQEEPTTPLPQITQGFVFRAAWLSPRTCNDIAFERGHWFNLPCFLFFGLNFCTQISSPSSQSMALPCGSRVVDSFGQYVGHEADPK